MLADDTAVQVLTVHRSARTPGQDEYTCVAPGCGWAFQRGDQTVVEFVTEMQAAFARHLIEQLAAARVPPTLEPPLVDEGLRSPHVVAWLAQDRDQQRRAERERIASDIDASWADPMGQWDANQARAASAAKALAARIARKEPDRG